MFRAGQAAISALIISGPWGGDLWAQLRPEPWHAPRLSQIEFENIIELFQFEDADKEAVIRLLRDDMLKAFQARFAATKASFEDIQETRAAHKEANPGVQPWIMQGEDFGTHQLIFQWRADRRQLENRFEADVGEILDPQRRAMWNDITQRLRRNRILPEIRHLGELRSSADLIGIVECIRLTDDEQKAIAELLVDYGEELDSALRDWEENVDEVQSQLLDRSGSLSEPQSEVAQRQSARLRSTMKNMAKAAGDVNIRFVDEIAWHLGDESRDQFFFAIGRIEYPDVFLPSPVDMAVEAIRNSKLVNEEQRESIQAIYVGYCGERAELQRRIIRSIRAWERPSAVAERLALHQEIVKEGGDPTGMLSAHAAIEDLHKRRNLAKVACETIRNVFNSTQYDSLPLHLQILLSWHSNPRTQSGIPR